MADEGGGTGRRKRLADADARLRRFQDAIGAGIDPNALIDAINQAQAQRAAARAELDNTPAPEAITDAEIHAMIDLARQTDRTSRMDQRTRERLHPTVDRDVVDLGAAFGQQLLDLSVRQSVAQVPRTATMITSGGNLNPANPDCDGGTRSSVATTYRHNQPARPRPPPRQQVR